MQEAILRREEGAMQPPLGVEPNFVDPQNRNDEIIAVAVIALIFSTAFVAARTYTRLMVIKSHGWEDCEWFPSIR